MDVQVTTLNLTREEAEILILENAEREAKARLVRVTNRLEAVKEDQKNAIEGVLNATYKLEMARARYLRAVV